MWQPAPGNLSPSLGASDSPEAAWQDEPPAWPDGTPDDDPGLRDAFSAGQAMAGAPVPSSGETLPASWWLLKRDAAGKISRERQASSPAWTSSASGKTAPAKTAAPAARRLRGLGRDPGPGTQAGRPAGQAGAKTQTAVPSPPAIARPGAAPGGGTGGARRAAPAQAPGRPGARGMRDRGLRRSPGPSATPVPPRPAPRPRRPVAPPAPRQRPLLLSKALGKDSIRPPRVKVMPPDLRYLQGRTPRSMPDLSPFRAQSASLSQIESSGPPDAKAVAGARPCRSRPHWHPGRQAHHYHDGAAWGRWERGTWTWFAKKGGRWWTWAGPTVPALLRHGDHWWWSTEQLWFLLHEGEPWGYRHFSDLDRLEGFIHPATGTRMVYSADGSKVAVVSQDRGAVLFDATSGAVLGRWGPEELPKPRGPTAPSSLSFPP